MVKAAAVLSLVGLSGVLAVQPAAAHATGYSKSRSGCHYSGGVASLDTFAWTQKDSGNCSGHAWVRVQFTDGTYSGDVHAPGRAEVYGPVRHAWHKTQSGESWVQSH
jgi:hypothetical protein